MTVLITIIIIIPDPYCTASTFIRTSYLFFLELLRLVHVEHLLLFIELLECAITIGEGIRTADYISPWS